MLERKGSFNQGSPKRFNKTNAARGNKTLDTKANY